MDIYSHYLIDSVAQWFRAPAYIVGGHWFDSSPCRLSFPKVTSDQFPTLVIQGFFPLSVLSLVLVLVLKVLPSVRSVLLSVGSFSIEELRVFLAHSVIHWFSFEIREVVHLQSRGELRLVS